LLFAIHPVNTEAVDVISFRKDLLAFLFFMSSFVLYLRLDVYHRAKRNLAYIFSILLFLCAVFSKEMAITLPLLLLAYDYYFVAKGEMTFIFSRIKSRYLGYFFAAAFYLWVWRFLMWNKEVLVGYPGGSFLSNALTMATVFAGYCKWMVFGWGVHATLADASLFSYSATPKVIMSFALLGLLWYACVKFFRISKILSFSILWFFIALLPVCNILPIRNIMAARYLYVPLAGFCLFFAGLLLYAVDAKVLDPAPATFRRIIWCLVAGLLVFYASVTILRNRVWKNGATFWSEMAKIYPHRALPHYELGNYFSEGGAGDQAIEEYKESIRMDPGFIDAYINLSDEYHRMHKTQEAVLELEKARKLSPDVPIVYVDLGALCLEKELFSEAVQNFEHALKLDPKYMPAYEGLGVAYARMGNFKEARKIWEKGLTINSRSQRIKDNLATLKGFGH
jgi:tetratricopeptide (TPR) repeat protein